MELGDCAVFNKWVVPRFAEYRLIRILLDKSNPVNPFRESSVLTCQLREHLLDVWSG